MDTKGFEVAKEETLQSIDRTLKHIEHILFSEDIKREERIAALEKKVQELQGKINQDLDQKSFAKAMCDSLRGSCE